MYVIITDVEYRMSLAAIRCLSACGFRVICVSTKPPEMAIGAASRYVEKCYTIPSSLGDEKKYIDQLDIICKSYADANEGNFPVVFPVGKFTLYALAKFPLIYGRALVAPVDVLDAANDKSSVLALAASLGIAVPLSYERNGDETSHSLAARITYPCVIKYRDGEALGLKAPLRYRITQNPEEFAVHYDRMAALQSAPLVQQYIGGDGWGFSCVFHEGRIVDSICHRRIREYPVSGGPSTCCVTEVVPALEVSSEKLLSALGFEGIAMVEYKGSRDGGFYLMEVNPRLWGSFALTRAAGSRFAESYCKAAVPPATNVCGGQEENMSPIDKLRALFPYLEGVKMCYRLNDAAACLSYLKQGNFQKGLGALKDICNPLVKDGVFEWSDPKPFFRYLKTMLKR